MIRYDEPYKLNLAIDDCFHSNITFDDILDDSNQLLVQLTFSEQDLQALSSAN
jgi:hypothetical protein